MLKVGLTGGIGSGKSTVADEFAKLGVAVIDTDVISHQLSRRADVLDQIRQCFGDAVINNEGQLDRKCLAGIVFSDAARRHELEAIMHPLIRQQVIAEYDANQQADYVIVVVPLLLETGFGGLVDRILVVDISEEEQLRRVSLRDQRDSSEIHAIINRQINRQQRLAKADDVIDNSGSQKDLQARVAELHRLYLNA